MLAFNIRIFFSVLVSSLTLCSQNNAETTEKPLEEISTENPCSDVHTCSLEHRICRCDPECTIYGDCCFDYVNVTQLAPFPEYTCYSLEPLQGVFLKSRCKNGWDDVTVRRQCEQRVPGDQNWIIPVTNTNTNVSFRNKYCAKCNEEDDVIDWELIVECPTLDDPNDTAGLIYDGPSGRWGVWVYKGGRSNFHPCNLRASLPYNVSRGSMRECVPNVKQECPAVWNDEAVTQKCLTYYSPINVGGKLYANTHCAMCNGEQEKEKKCLGSRYQRNVTPPGFYSVDGNVNTPLDCKENELYDPSLKRCRGLSDVCKMMRLVYKDGQCVPQ